MKRTVTLFIVALTAVALARPVTLGESTREVSSRSQGLITKAQTMSATWGTKTALRDLESLNRSAQELEVALKGHDAALILEQQRVLATASRRIGVSGRLLPASIQPELRELQSRVADIDSRITQIRLRFATKASSTPRALSEVALFPDETGLEVYDNPADLLIDVRAANLLVRSLSGESEPAYAIGIDSSYELEPSQINRLVRAAEELQSNLSGRYSDVRESLPSWKKMKREYDRIGYLAPTTTSRQLERVMERLGSFFGAYE